MHEFLRKVPELSLTRQMGLLDRLDLGVLTEWTL